jgi:hypothetical protein
MDSKENFHNIDLVEDALLLVEQNFYFLHAGEFFTSLSKEKDLTIKNDLNVKKYFDNNSTYHFNPKIIKEILIDAKKSNNHQTILFEYFVEFNAFRGICMAMVEALRLETPFRSFIQSKLKNNFENFFDILSFIRNVLSHNIHADIFLLQKDFDGTLKRIRRMKRNPNVSFDFTYSYDLPEINAPFYDYGFICSIDFESLQVDTPFLDVVSLWELMMISELCFNFAIVYKKIKNV